MRCLEKVSTYIIRLVGVDVAGVKIHGAPIDTNTSSRSRSVVGEDVASVEVHYAPEDPNTSSMSTQNFVRVYVARVEIHCACTDDNTTALQAENNHALIPWGRWDVLQP
jgi:hypothetical protein